MTATQPTPTARRTSGSPDELDHLYCCDPDIALCGTDISDHEDNGADGSCIVCLDLEDNPCDCA
ncbi:hypothetical protein [Streptomyces racemochromogenes]|uniref:hypothetical protein n=1 Tax=Streptomyces racemochromogenes TaxID=67353 RepID=UPI0031F09A05